MQQFVPPNVDSMATVLIFSVCFTVFFLFRELSLYCQLVCRDFVLFQVCGALKPTHEKNITHTNLSHVETHVHRHKLPHVTRCVVVIGR